MEKKQRANSTLDRRRHGRAVEVAGSVTVIRSVQASASEVLSEEGISDVVGRATTFVCGDMGSIRTGDILEVLPWPGVDLRVQNCLPG